MHRYATRLSLFLSKTPPVELSRAFTYKSYQPGFLRGRNKIKGIVTIAITYIYLALTSYLPSLPVFWLYTFTAQFQEQLLGYYDKILSNYCAPS